MKTNNLRANRTRRSKLAGLALAAILSVFPISRSMGADYEVGNGKPYATLDVLRKSVTFNAGDSITLYGDDGSVQEAFKGVVSGQVTFRPADNVQDVLTINGANINKERSLFLVQEFGVFNIEPGLEFNHFRSKENGGTISALNGGTVNIAGTTFLNSKSDKSGGALYGRGGNVNLFGANFTNNNAALEGGAGSFIGGSLAIDTSFFAGNSAIGGGALHVENTQNAGIANSVFDSNTGDNGGAILLRDATLTVTNSSFWGNDAAGKGGAILLEGRSVLNLRTDAGFSSAFAGNTDSVGDNSIFFELGSNNMHINQVLSVSGDGDLLMSDPMRAVQVATALNGDSKGKLQINKSGTGTWTLTGANVFRTDDIAVPDKRLLTTEFVVAQGTLALADGASVSIDRGYFSVEKDAKIQAGVNSNVTVTSSTLGGKGIVFKNGSGLVVDMLSNTGGTNYLTLNGAAPITGQFGVDVRNIAGDGTYTLVTATGAGFTTANTEVLIDGRGVATDNDRLGTRAVGVTGDTITLTVAGMDSREDVVWNGQDGVPGGNVWSQEAANWTGGLGGTSNYFINGDLSATFGNSAALSKNVVVDAGGVTVGDIVMAGDYTFSGGKVRVEAFGPTDGKLTFTGDGSLTLAGGDVNRWDAPIAVNDDVFAGLNAADGQKVVVSSANGTAVQIGTDAHFSIGTVGSLGTVIFENMNGLAVSGNPGSTLQLNGGKTVFRNLSNTAGDGSAADVDTVRIVTDGGDVRFKNNLSAGLGGALHVRRDLELYAIDGDVKFRGNLQDSSSPNAVYMAGSDGNGAYNVVLHAEENQRITFYDPIETRALSGSLSDTFWIDVTGDGAVRFDAHQSKVHGITNVYGTMQLTGGAVYGADSGNLGFTLHDGATLLSDSRGNAVKAETIRLDGGSTIRIDLEARQNFSDAALTLVADNFDLPDDTQNNADKLAIDVVNPVEDGRYLLLVAEGAGFSEENTIGTVNGSDPGANSQNDRVGQNYFEIEPNRISLRLSGYDINRTVYWTGEEGDDWNQEDANWRNDGTTSRYFLSRDTVVFNDASQSRTVDVDAGGVFVKDMTVLSGDYTFNGGTIEGSGKLEKSGRGTLLLQQRNEFGEGVHIYAGRLAGSNGDEAVVTGNLTLYSGAALDAGSGNAGRFHVDGNIAFNAGSYVYLDLGSTAAASDLLSATGKIDFSANMEGTTTVVLGNNGIGENDAAYQGEIIHADGGLHLNGQVIADGTREAKNDTVTIQRGANKLKITADSSLSLESAEIGDSGRGLSISVVGADPEQPPTPTWRITQNHRNLLASLQGSPTFTFGNSLLAQVSVLPDSEKGYFLEQALHTVNSAGTAASFRNAENIRNIMHYRIDNLFDVPPSEYNGLLGNRRGLFRGQRYCPNGAPVLWLQNYGDFLHQGRRATQGYQSDSYGIALGFDYWLDSNLVLGMSFGGGFSSLKTADRSQSGSVDSFIYAVYGSYTTSDRVRLTGSFGFVYSDYELRRTPAGIPVSSKHSGDMGFAAFEVSKKFRGDWTDITPFASLDFVYLDEDGYNETDAAGQRIARVKGGCSDSVLQKLGVRFGRTRVNRFGWTATPSVWAGWIHDYGGGNFYTVATYEGATPYRVKGASMNQDRIGVGLNYNAKVNRSFSFFGGYNAEYASRFSVHTIQAGLTLEF